MAAIDEDSPAETEGHDLEQYVDKRLFDDSIGTLADHVARKAALGDTRRYAILFLLGERGEMARKEIQVAVADSSFDLSHHLGELVDVGLISRTGAPEGADGRQTFYKITHLGQQELDADYRNVTGHDPTE
ncbi:MULTISPECIES: helix-turn-helix transcriptional regulator [unclassified Haladaptatus]|uniref:ArsR/SmtB family transcription factor n=1 Tax=unclassified Haladaptatus TaxID=2622732 RepID=UPI0023E78CE2|nr:MULTISPECIES: hypothetical protein [unclassified Haladaptatus]